MKTTVSLEEAVSAHESGDLTTAIALYRFLLVSEPARLDVLINLGIALCQSGNPSDGLEMLERAVSLGEHDGMALYNFGYALLENGQYIEAMSILTRAAEVSPDDPEIKHALVRVGRCLSDRAAAVPETGKTTVPSASAKIPRQQTSASESPSGGNDEVSQVPPAIRGRERKTRPPAKAHRDWDTILEHLDVLELIYSSHGFDEKLRGLLEKRQDLLDPSVYVFIIGESKFGKSSLINHLLGVKVAEVKKLPQTWRVDLYRPVAEGEPFAEIKRYGRDTPERFSTDEAHEICKDQEPEVLRRGKAAKDAPEGKIGRAHV